MIIITDDMRNNLEYDGKTRKFGVTIDNKNYLIKFAKNNTYSVYSEYVASKFMNNIGVPAHNVSIGIYNNTGELINIIEDFNNEVWKLKQFKDLNESSVNTSIGVKEYTYKDVLNILDSISRIRDSEKKLLIHRFWQMFICDAILANRDRHHGNWGFLRNTKTKEIIAAPLFDNGACLFPDVYKLINDFTLNEKEFIRSRTDRFPASLLMKYNKKLGREARTNYKEILSDVRFNSVLAMERRQLIDKVGLTGVTSAIYKSTLIDMPDILRRFYRLIVIVRYLTIIERYEFEKAYDIALNEVNKYDYC